MLWELFPLLLLLKSITFEISANLGVVSYNINAAVRHVLILLLLALVSCWVLWQKGWRQSWTYQTFLGLSGMVSVYDSDPLPLASGEKHTP